MDCQEVAVQLELLTDEAEHMRRQLLAVTTLAEELQEAADSLDEHAMSEHVTERRSYDLHEAASRVRAESSRIWAALTIE